MKRTRICTLSLLFAGVLVASPVFADRPPWAGGGDEDNGYSQQEERHGEHERYEHSERERHERKRHERFSEQDRSDIRGYYGEQFHNGRCPPGLARKHNGCMAPGQARKWKVGQPLPRDVTYYNLPSKLAERIGPPPAGHRYVRVANDILLIAVGTGMVEDAINDLGRQ